jgi:hypothetical protein
MLFPFSHVLSSSPLNSSPISPPPSPPINPPPKKEPLTFVFFILHLSHAFHTLLRRPSSSGLLVPRPAIVAALFGPRRSGFDVFSHLDGGLLLIVVASLSVEGGGIVVSMCGTFIVGTGRVLIVVVAGGGHGCGGYVLR